MGKRIQKLRCSECMEFLSRARGGPLMRIACANCRQAKHDLPGHNSEEQGIQLKAALEALSRGELITMPDSQSAEAGKFTCPKCGKNCATKEALGSHRKVHGRGSACKRPAMLGTKGF